MTDKEITEFLAEAPDVCTIARRAASWIDVLMSRSRPDSAYIPMRGART